MGAHELILDSKGRLSIPTALRKNFDPADGGSLFATIRDSVPWFYPLGHFRRLMKRQMSPELMPSELHHRYVYLTLSLGAEVECDAAGRIVVPDSILSRADLGRKPNQGTEVVLAGVNDHLELLSKTRWLALRQELINESKVLEAWAKDALKKPAAQEHRTTPQPSA